LDLETAKVRARNSLTVIGTEMTKEILKGKGLVRRTGK
jgi:hypothetical protein